MIPRVVFCFYSVKVDLGVIGQGKLLNNAVHMQGYQSPLLLNLFERISQYTYLKSFYGTDEWRVYPYSVDNQN